MEIKFRLKTLFLGVLTGASTLAMFVKNKPFTYVTGTICILTFIGFILMDVKNN